MISKEERESLREELSKKRNIYGEAFLDSDYYYKLEETVIKLRKKIKSIKRKKK